MQRDIASNFRQSHAKIFSDSEPTNQFLWQRAAQPFLVTASPPTIFTAKIGISCSSRKYIFEETHPNVFFLP